MRPDLNHLFNPRSVAIVGASSDPTRLTGRPLQILRRHGFAGDIWLVHPRLQEIDGVLAYPTIEDLPNVPDVVLVMVRAELVPGIARSCGERGVKHLVVLSSGFEETEGGSTLSAELRSIAEHYSIGVVGPNSEGLWFVPGKTILTFGSAAMRDELVSGPIAVLSQSGSIGAAIMRQLNDVGVGADVFVSVGNETVLGVADYLRWVVERASVRVVVCFLEGLADGRAFLEAAAAARAAGVAVVVLKAGASERGREASASHTGKISSAATVYDALLAQAGVTKVETIEQLATAAAVLAGPPLRGEEGPGSGLTVLGLSGGSRSIIADATEVLDIPLATLSEPTTAELATFIPDFGVTTNPVDPTGQVLSDPALFPRTIEALAADPSSRALLIQYANGGTALLHKHLPVLANACSTYGIPVVVSCLLDQLPATDRLRQELAKAGIAYVHDPTSAVQALSLLFQAQREVAPILAREEAGDDSSVSSWDDVARFVAAAGLRTPQEIVVDAAADEGTVAGALDAAGLEYPLVVKPSPDDVLHKSELGLVFLDLQDSQAVTAAVRKIEDSLGAGTRALVQEMVSSDVEALVVLQTDADFGPVMGLGLGGFFVELLQELSYVALPASPSQVAAAMERTRLARLLRGYRGSTGVDVGLVAERFAVLGAAYARLDKPPRTLELNPVVVVDAERLYAIDSLVEPYEGLS